MLLFDGMYQTGEQNEQLLGGWQQRDKGHNQQRSSIERNKSPIQFIQANETDLGLLRRNCRTAKTLSVCLPTITAHIHSPVAATRRKQYTTVNLTVNRDLLV